VNILIDSSVLIALHDSDDVHHQRSVKDLTQVQKQGDEMWMSEHVLDEVLTILSKRRKDRQIKHLWQLLESNQIHLFLPQSTNQAWQIMRQTYDLLIQQEKKRASYTDLHQVVLVNHHYLQDASILSYDHHLTS